MPRLGALADCSIAALQAGISTRPVAVRQAATAGAPTPVARLAFARLVQAAPSVHARVSAVEMLGRIGGFVLLCIALVFAAQQAVRYLPAWPQEWIPADPNEPVQRPPQSDPDITPAPKPDAAQDAAQEASARKAADAINTELRRVGIDRAAVRLAKDGTATLTGRVESADERDALLRWLQSVPGITGIVNEIEIDTKVKVAPPLPLPRATAARRPAVPEAVPAQPVPAVRPAVPVPQVYPDPVPRAAAPAPPDAASVASAVQRELARLALSGITVDVAPTLEVTLRGTTRDAARKAQALAAARAATPSGRVRDLVFVIEE